MWLKLFETERLKILFAKNINSQTIASSIRGEKPYSGKKKKNGIYPQMNVTEKTSNGHANGHAYGAPRKWFCDFFNNFNRLNSQLSGCTNARWEHKSYSFWRWCKFDFRQP